MLTKSDLRHHAPLIYSLRGCETHDDRNVIVSGLNDPAFDFVCKCIRQVTHHPETLGLPYHQLNQLRTQLNRDKKSLLYLGNPKYSRHKKRKVVAHQTGAGIGMAIAALLPVVIQAVQSIFGKKKK